MAAVSTREAKQAERRDRVIEAAILLARDGGYDAVQMRDVAASADVALGTIYRYFSSKDEMLLAGLAGWVEKIRCELAELPPVSGSPADRLVHVLEEASLRTERRPTLMRALVVALGTTDPAANAYRDQIENSVSGIVLTAIGDEHDVDWVGVRRIVGHVWFSALSRWVTGRAPDGSVAAELRHAARMLLD